jgi:hypothetical protein
MKLKILILLTAVAATFGWGVLAQINAPASLRVVNGQVYNIAKSKSWGVPPYPETPNLNPLDNPWNVISYSLEFQAVRNEKMITCGVYRCEYEHEKWTGQLGLNNKTFVKWVVIYHFPEPKSLVTGQAITPICMKVGNYFTNGLSFEAYDCGTPPTLDEYMKFKADLEEQQKAAQKEIEDQRRAATEKAADAKKIAQAKVVKWNQEQADKGDPYGLLRMGEFYRDGNGVPKDLDKAREYLTKASAAGSANAADELSKLNRVSTNAPANSK